MKSYYMIFDTSIPYTDTRHVIYFSVSDGSDILGTVTRWHGHEIKNVRLFRFPTKKQWLDSWREWAHAAKL